MGVMYFCFSTRLLDSSAGDWPFVQAEQLARMALRCCDIYGRNRPNLESDVWRVLEPMKVSCQSFQLASDDYIPHYLLCPIFQVGVVFTLIFDRFEIDQKPMGLEI
jgi:hypothetical protein